MTARCAAAAVGMNERTFRDAVRDGLLPSVLHDGKRRYRIVDVVTAHGALSAVTVRGRLCRNGSRGRSLMKRDAERDTPTRSCIACKTDRAAREFPPSSQRRQSFICKACKRAGNQREREELSDGYVKDQLRKQSGLRSADMPRALVEAFRAYLMVKRLLRKKGK